VPAEKFCRMRFVKILPASGRTDGADASASLRRRFASCDDSMKRERKKEKRVFDWMEDRKSIVIARIQEVR